jgi:hypothetical protein
MYLVASTKNNGGDFKTLEEWVLSNELNDAEVYRIRSLSLIASSFYALFF